MNTKYNNRIPILVGRNQSKKIPRRITNLYENPVYCKSYCFKQILYTSFILNEALTFSVFLLQHQFSLPTVRIASFHNSRATFIIQYKANTLSPRWRVNVLITRVRYYHML